MNDKQDRVDMLKNLTFSDCFPYLRLLFLRSNDKRESYYASQKLAHPNNNIVHKIQGKLVPKLTLSVRNGSNLQS